MSNNLENLKNFFDEKVKSPVFFVHPNVNFGIGLEKLINNFHIICSRKSDLVKQLSNEGISVFCLNNDRINNSAEILRNKKTLEFINKVKEKARNNQPLITTFKPSPALEKICAENNFKYLGNDWRLNRELENKIKFNEVLKKLKIPSAESEIIDTDKINYQHLKNKFGKKFIVQLPRGFSGNSTFLVTPSDLPLSRGGDKISLLIKEGLGNIFGKKIKISKFIKGPTITFNACLLKSGLLTGWPFYQITGEKKLNQNILGSCGNDFAVDLKLNKKALGEIYNYTKLIGEYLKTLDYKGIFGLDFVIDENNQEVHLIEINPRLTASIPVFTKLQIKNNKPPFLALHILEFLGLDYFRNVRDTKCLRILDIRYNFSQLILRNTADSPVEISKNIPSGIYKIENNKLKFIKPAYCLESLNNQNEFLIQCLSFENTINPNIEYANVQINDAVIDNDFELRNKIKIILELLFEEIELRKNYSPPKKGLS